MKVATGGHRQHGRKENQESGRELQREHVSPETTIGSAASVLTFQIYVREFLFIYVFIFVSQFELDFCH